MSKTVKKYLIPNKENDFKPHLFRKAGITAVALIATAVFAVGVFQNILFLKTDFLSAVLPGVLVDFANQDRAQNQIASLTVNPTLEAIAQTKANDMAANSYFSHNSPTGKIWYTWFADGGYQYAYAGENLAVNFSDSDAVNVAWMNSPDHRANLLNGKFTEIGIATSQGVYNGRQTIFVVQEFGKPLSKAAQAVTAIKNVINPPLKATTTSVKPPAPKATTTLVATTKVLGESTAPTPKQTVLVETPTFVAVENSDANAGDTLGTQSSVASPVSSQAAKFFTEPKKIYSIFYLSLAGLILLALLLMIVIEIKHQHPKNVVAGVFLILFILLLLYIFRMVVFGPVLVI